MQLKVKLYATLSKYAPDGRAGTAHEIDLPEDGTVRDLLEHLEVPLAEARVIFVNGRAAELDRKLEPGDEVGVFPAVGGG